MAQHRDPSRPRIIPAGLFPARFLPAGPLPAGHLPAGLLRACCLAVLLVAALPPAAPARPRPEPAPRPLTDLLHPPRRGAMAGGVFQAASQGTTWFGGTQWDAVDGRWEAIPGGTWTFDSGVGSDFDHAAPDVNPFKDPGLHARMEGWTGIDFTYVGDLPYFRRLTAGDPGWDAVCVGSGAGLGGAASFWAGVLDTEAAALCYGGGQGYANSWLLTVAKEFAYPGAGTLTLDYDFVNETEPAFDYTHVRVDTTGNGDTVDLVSYTGVDSGHETLLLEPGITLPSAAGTVRLEFTVESDGAYSDEDGLFTTTCGAFAVDDIQLSGALTDLATFEAGDDGWMLLPAPPGEGGDWTDIRHVDDLPPVSVGPCQGHCAVEDSVLVFFDPSLGAAGGHPLYQDNIAASPWIDLETAGLTGTPGRVLEWSGYLDLPSLDYIYYQVQFQYYPYVPAGCAGPPQVSPWRGPSFYGYPGPVGQFCFNDARLDVETYFVGLEAERVRVGLGVLNFCRFFGNCAGLSNTTPWYDDIRFGVYGAAGAPLLAASSTYLPLDSFPQNGGVAIDAPGRVDANQVKGASTHESWSSLGDTLVVYGGSGGAEVHVQFAVDPGPGIDGGRLASWLGSHAPEGNHGADRHGAPLAWYSARMDTAKYGAATTFGSYFMTAYHEDDANFTGSDLDTDPNDLDPHGNATRKANDIFPDDLFTPGTRLMLFYRTRYDGSGLPFTGAWYTWPDTADGNHLEMEVLPSSMDADSTFNCLLYVDHVDGLPTSYATGDFRENQEDLEAALGAVLAGGSANVENVPWDRYDVRAPTSYQASFGRPYRTQNGATVSQAMAYSTILWDSGAYGAGFSGNDAAVLRPWLEVAATERRFYGMGASLVESVLGPYGSQDPAAAAFMRESLGVDLVCPNLAAADCPGGSVQDDARCMPLGPVPGPHFTWSTPSVVRGSGCPERRDLDVLTGSASALGDARANANYHGPAKGVVSHASVTHRVTAGAGYKSVVDGFSATWLREPGCSVEATAARLADVFAWFGIDGTETCEESFLTVGTPDDPRPDTPPAASLRIASAHPVRTAARLRLALPRDAEIRARVFDLRGRAVAGIGRGAYPAGEHDLTWDLTDERGLRVASGVYFVRVEGVGDLSRRLVVLR